MASDRTQLRGSAYDARRLYQGITGNLLIQQKAATGYTTIGTISSGWISEHEDDEVDDTQNYAVRVALTDPNVTVLTSAVRKYISACVVMGRQYVFKRLVDTPGDPAIWVILCAPTGEPVS